MRLWRKLFPLPITKVYLVLGGRNYEGTQVVGVSGAQDIAETMCAVHAERDLSFDYYEIEEWEIGELL